jgi:putative endonuclease
MNRTGSEAEALCARHLRDAGLRVLARNWRCRQGELDLVAAEGTTIVFVEVRLRQSRRFGGAGESVTAAKRARIVAAAKRYLAGRRTESDCRFDVLLLDRLEGGRIEWIRDAFGEG